MATLLALGIRCFSLDKIIEMDDAFLDDSHDHQHDARVSSVGVDVAGEVIQQKLNAAEILYLRSFDCNRETIKSVGKNNNGIRIFMEVK